MVEDALHQAVVNRICNDIGCDAPAISVKNGKAKVIDRERIRKMHTSSYAHQFFLLIDLDNDADCRNYHGKRRAKPTRRGR